MPFVSSKLFPRLQKFGAYIFFLLISDHSCWQPKTANNHHSQRKFPKENLEWFVISAWIGMTLSIVLGLHGQILVAGGVQGWLL